MRKRKIRGSPVIPRKNQPKVRLVVYMDRQIYEKAKALQIDLHTLCRWRIAEAIEQVEIDQLEGV